MTLPASIIFINPDMDGYVRSTLTSQLHINEIMTDVEFDARVVADPNYPSNVELQGLRILVIRQSFHDITNRKYADIVLFYSHGMVTVEYKGYGPPSLTLPIERLNLYTLLRFNNSSHVMILPKEHRRPSACCCANACCCGLGGIFAIEARDTSGVHCPNTDRESNNEDFINRK